MPPPNPSPCSAISRIACLRRLEVGHRDDLAAAGVVVLGVICRAGSPTKRLSPDSSSLREVRQAAADLLRRTRRCCRSAPRHRRRRVDSGQQSAAAASRRCSTRACRRARPARAARSSGRSSTASRENRCRSTWKSVSPSGRSAGNVGTKSGRRQVGRAADRVQDVRGERQVQHLLDGDDAEHMERIASWCRGGSSTAPSGTAGSSRARAAGPRAGGGAARRPS